MKPDRESGRAFLHFCGYSCGCDLLPGIVRVAHAVFGNPLIAYCPHVLIFVVPLPGQPKRGDRSDNGEARDDPDRIHRRFHVFHRAGAVCIRFRFHISPHATHRQ